LYRLERVPIEDWKVVTVFVNSLQCVQVSDEW